MLNVECECVVLVENICGMKKCKGGAFKTKEGKTYESGQFINE